MNKKNIFISSVQGEFQEEAFKVVLYRKTESTTYVTPHVTDHVKKLLLTIIGEMDRYELQMLLEIKERRMKKETINKEIEWKKY